MNSRTVIADLGASPRLGTPALLSTIFDNMPLMRMLEPPASTSEKLSNQIGVFKWRVLLTGLEPQIQ
jgi:hypothetical protein